MRPLTKLPTRQFLACLLICLGLMLPSFALSAQDTQTSPKKKITKQLAEVSQKKSAETGANASPPKSLALGWSLFKQEKYEEAMDAFSALSNVNPALKPEATYGIALCHIKTKNFKKAIPLLEETVEKRLFLNDALPQLISAFVVEKDYAKAETYIQQLPPNDKSRWDNDLKDWRLAAAFEKTEGDPNTLAEFIRNNVDALEMCQSPETFFKAINIVARGDVKFSINAFQRMLLACPNKWPLRLSIFYRLKRLMKTPEILHELDIEEVRKDLDPEYKEQLAGVRLSVLKKQLAAVRPVSPEIEQLTEEIRKIKPDDIDALSLHDREALGRKSWEQFNNAQYDEAFKGFSALHKIDAENPDHAVGMMNVMIKKKKYFEAQNLADQYKNNKKIEELRKEVQILELKEQLDAAKSDSPEVEKLVAKILALKSDDTGALTSLAWWYFRKGKYNDAYKGFSSLHKSDPEKVSYATGMVNVLIKQKKFKEAHELAAQYKNSKDMAVLEKEIQIAKIRDELSTLETDSPDVETLAGKLLKLKPGDTGALSTLAWWHYNNSRYDEAYKRFNALHNDDPQRASYISGMISSLIKQKKYNDAQALADKYKNSKDKEIASLAKDTKLAILKDQLSELKNDSPEIEALVAKIFAINPGDRDALLKQSWWHYNNDRYDEAFKGFSSLHDRDPAKDAYAAGMIYALMGMKKYDEALTLAHKYKDSANIISLEKDVRIKVMQDKALASDSPEEVQKLGEEMLALKPNDDNVRLTVGWLYFNKDLYDLSYKEFTTLYNKNPEEKGYGAGLAYSLINMKRLDEALDIIIKSKKFDESLAAAEVDIYRQKADAAYKEKNYPAAEIYFAKVLETNPEDENTKELLAISRYSQTTLGKTLSHIEGLSGFSYGTLNQDIRNTNGFNYGGLINQGVDWFRLPADIVFNTYAEAKYTDQTRNNTFIKQNGTAAGIALKQSIFRFGAEYSWLSNPLIPSTTNAKQVYVSWYTDWYKYMKKRVTDEDSWQIPMQALSGFTYGRLNKDFNNIGGLDISGVVNQGIDWFTLPGNLTFNTYGEFRFNYRTVNGTFYNAYGPAVGMELQRKPLKIGMDFYLENDPDLHQTVQKATIYLRWYFDWNLKPGAAGPGWGGRF